MRCCCLTSCFSFGGVGLTSLHARLRVHKNSEMWPEMRAAIGVRGLTLLGAVAIVEAVLGKRGPLQRIRPLGCSKPAEAGNHPRRLKPAVRFESRLPIVTQIAVAQVPNPWLSTTPRQKLRPRKRRTLPPNTSRMSKLLTPTRLTRVKISTLRMLKQKSAPKQKLRLNNPRRLLNNLQTSTPPARP